MKVNDQTIIDAIRKNLPDAQVTLKALDCSKLGYYIEVKSSIFKDKSLIEQHRSVKSALSNLLDSEVLHAVTLKTTTA
ncbi:Putative transcriptional regulator, BolA protein family [Candidatus Phycorickettsia trachydisci]|uniref:Transcriptional regulator, BolA protein family n=1 Tax=Candidatus Phycorickettsia trachydisci TaxID=2115978 RepID=A0A2P1P9B8_9RICK|nr:BolA/IbaG family iron-sulfur metabolism protein [Candidatus Phycorickettsia trachydisci]AVP87853.1 Putative transcriptional regulator, BolA protein family [Candidatus Phycorickettsia trachydisci]